VPCQALGPWAWMQLSSGYPQVQAFVLVRGGIGVGWPTECGYALLVIDPRIQYGTRAHGRAGQSGNCSGVGRANGPASILFFFLGGRGISVKRRRAVSEAEGRSFLSKELK